MNKTKQFWALVKFQVAINPFVFIFPLAMATPYYIPYITRLPNYHPGIEFLISNQNLFLVAIIGFMLVAPEIMRTGVSAAAWPTGSEFLLTRAVDRHLVLRSRSATFYLLVLAIPLFALLLTVRNPSLQVSEFDKVAHQQVLDHMPGSIAVPADRAGRMELITIPDGNTLLNSWHLWQFLCLAMVTQAFVFLIYGLRYAKVILWGTFILLVFLPLLAVINRGYKGGGITPAETIFFAFVSHPGIFWGVTIVALVVGQFWCESRFVSSEH